MFCTSCGHEHDSRSRFCARCGAATSSPGGMHPALAVPVPSSPPLAIAIPHPAPSPFACWARAFRHYVVFTGRASRAEFWFFLLFNTLAQLTLGAIGNAIGAPVLGTIFCMATLLPGISAGVRRLHDTGHSGWLYLVPLYGLFLLCLPGTAGPNPHGPPPDLIP